MAHFKACSVFYTNVPRHGNSVFGVFDQVRHKLGCTAAEDGLRLEILD